MDDFAELRTAVDGFTAATTEALQETRKDLKALTSQVDKIEIRLNRPGVLGCCATTKPISRRKPGQTTCGAAARGWTI